MSPVPAEGAHFLGQSLHMVTRLRDHVERLDDGAAYAADDLAVVLRALLHPGRGNDVLSRLGAYAGHCASEIMVSRAPDLTARFSVGSIPTRDVEAHGSSLVSIEEWSTLPVVHIRDESSSTTYTWAELLNTYANKWGGAHLDRVVPLHLQVIDVYATGSLNLSGYLLRTAAITAWRAGQELLRAALPSPSQDDLTEEQLTTRLLSAPGGADGQPADRLSEGELQWLTYTGDTTSFLIYADAPCRLRISRGGSHTAEIELMPQSATGTASPFNEVRSPAPLVYSPDEFSQERIMRVSGWVVTPPASQITHS